MAQRSQPNRLIHEASLYLRQHAHNPVDWYPWGPEALERARREDKPILVSIGYAACHWCHVMERESFEDEAVARVMNEHFINIKVDREERPDVDRIYMNAVVAMTGHGGWPLNCFITPDGRPFFAGTYFPPTPRYRMPAWRQVLGAILDIYGNQRDKVERQADELLAALARHDLRPDAQEPPADALERAFGKMMERFDAENGGFGTQPKFPNVMALELMAQVATDSRAEMGMEFVELALDRMAAGGIRDHLGGGFARYSTDARWLVPHFEKMLYDNALLPRLYLHVHQLTGAPRHAEVVRDTLGWLQREMLAPEGGFYATLDADSEGVEGRYYVWTRDELVEVLGQEAAERFGVAYGVRDEGNWEGVNVLHRAVGPAALARRLGSDAGTLEAQLAQDRARLLAHRQGRVGPARDEKRLAAWNGLALQAFARAAAVLGDEALAGVARRCADFLRRELWRDEGLLRVYADGEDGPIRKIPGFLDDHAFVLLGLLDLYKATGDPRDLAWAVALGERIAARFFDPDSGVMHLTDGEAQGLPLRSASAEDEAVPSGAGAACLGWLRLGALTGQGRWGEWAERVIHRQARAMAQAPMAFVTLLAALRLLRRGVTTCVVIGAPDDPRAEALLARARHLAQPDQEVVAIDPTAPWPTHLDPELGQGRLEVDAPTAFVCQGRACLPPVTDPALLGFSIDEVLGR